MAAAALLMCTACGGQESSAKGARTLAAYQAVVDGAGTIHLAGIGRRGDRFDSCRDEGNAKEFLVARLDETGRLRGETSIPQEQIEGCAVWVDRAVLDEHGRLVLDGLFEKWPSGLLPGEGGPETALLVARINTDGSFDDSYDGDGVAVDPDENGWAGALASVPGPDGGRLYVEELDPYSGGARLIRTGRDGQVVGGWGARVAGVPGGADLSLGSSWHLAVDSARIYGFGRFFRDEESGEIMHLVFSHRLRDGKPDDTFGADGFVEPEPPGAKFWAAYDFELQPDGKPVVAGVVERRKRLKVFVGRFTAHGKPDRGFGTAGFVELDLARSAGDDRDWLASLALDSRGRIVLSAWILGSGTTVLRLRSDGSLDQSFGKGGRMKVPRL